MNPTDSLCDELKRGQETMDDYPLSMLQPCEIVYRKIITVAGKILTAIVPLILPGSQQSSFYKTLWKKSQYSCKFKFYKKDRQGNLQNEI